MLLLFRKNEYPVNNFTIYGERHSGTNLLERICTDSLSLDVTWDFGWKHFFGFVDYYKIVSAKNTLFFAITRNPYDWIMAMQSSPYHIPKKNEKPMSNFIYNEWFSIDDYGKEIKTDRNYLIGRKYKNIFEMRKTKLQYITAHMPKLCNNLCITTYENITDNTETFVRNISNYFDIKMSIKNLPVIFQRKKYDISQEIKDAIDSGIDWEIENYFGYVRR